MKRFILICLMGIGCVQLTTKTSIADPVTKTNLVFNRDSADIMYLAGKQEYNARKYSNAWRYFDKAAKFDPSNPEIQRSIADVCLLMNKMAPAIKALESVHQLKPEDNEVLWKLTQLYFNFSNWDKTIELCQQVKQRMPKQAGVTFMMGKSYYYLQNYGKGIQYLQSAVKEEPENSEANYLIGRMLVMMSNYKTAVPYYEKAMSIDSSQPTRFYELAMVLATAEEFNKSISWFQRALDKGYKPRDDFYTNMAYTMADAKQSDKAISMLKEILSRRPQDLSLLNGLADVCYHSGKYKDAIGYWDRILSYDDKNARALYMIGMSYMKTGNETDGKALCDRAIAMDPSLAVLKREKKMQ
ncbi:tetratricopeptide repeat protein [Chitinophagaceae bacterium MMS25-I14]